MPRSSPDRRTWPGRRLVVVSPHLDDAVLSVGATLAAAAARGAEVVVLTVLAGDPASAAPADEASRRAGFATVGAAACGRRAEDALACGAVGAHPVWLPFADDASLALPEPAELWRAVEPVVGGAHLVLLPGSPLRHSHHAWVAATLGPELARTAVPVGRYVEQPYATWSRFSRATLTSRGRAPGPGQPAPAAAAPGQARVRVTADPRCYFAKYRACRAYPSQLRVLHRLPVARIAAYDAVAGGEWLTLPADVAPAWRAR